MVVMEHNLDVMTDADWIIDVGSEGGDAGGTIVAQGSRQDGAAHACVWRSECVEIGTHGSTQRPKSPCEMGNSPITAQIDRSLGRRHIRGWGKGAFKSLFAFPITLVSVRFLGVREPPSVRKRSTGGALKVALTCGVFNAMQTLLAQVVIPTSLTRSGELQLPMFHAATRVSRQAHGGME